MPEQSRRFERLSNDLLVAVIRTYRMGTGWRSGNRTPPPELSRSGGTPPFVIFTELFFLELDSGLAREMGIAHQSTSQDGWFARMYMILQHFGARILSLINLVPCYHQFRLVACMLNF